MNLTKYTTNLQGLELVIDTDTDSVYASQSATARMCEKDESTIRRFATSAKWEVIEAESPTASGLRLSALLNEDQIFECLAKYNPSFLALCAKAGLRVYLLGLAGYETKPQLPVSNEEKLIQALEDKIRLQENNIQLQEEKLKLQKEVNEKNTYINKGIDDAPGIDMYLKDCQFLDPPNGEVPVITALGFLKPRVKELANNDSFYRSFRLSASQTYNAIRQRSPHKKYGITKNGNRCKICVYTESDLPILNIVLRNCLNSFIEIS